MSATPDFYVQDSTYVDDGAVIGPGGKVWRFGHILGVHAYALMVGVSPKRVGWKCQGGARLPIARLSACTDCGASHDVTDEFVLPLARVVAGLSR
jgi:hypothetical protein